MKNSIRNIQVVHRKKKQFLQAIIITIFIAGLLSDVWTGVYSLQILNIQSVRLSSRQIEKRITPYIDSFHRVSMQATISCNQFTYQARNIGYRSNVKLYGIQPRKKRNTSFVSNDKMEDDTIGTNTSCDVNKSEEDMIQPLYITIGPPCSGKTTWIQNYNTTNNTKLYDICIDDQPGVYVLVPTTMFLQNDTNILADSMMTQKPIQLPSKVLFGRTVQERVNEQRELSAILNRLGGVISNDDFKKAITSPILLHVVEDIIEEFKITKKNLYLPSAINLFIPEAIFRRQPSNNSINQQSYSAIERVEQLLYTASLSTPLAYGNTNTRPSDYAKALQMACERKRKVYFVVYSDNETELDIFDLPVSGGLKELVRRNIYRLLSTGRYIPYQVLADMRDRTNQLINETIMQPTISVDDSVKNNPNISKLYFHQKLAKIAGFEMDNDRFISSSSITEPARTASTPKFISPSNQSKQMKQRPWDRPNSAVRGYNGKLQQKQDKSVR